MMSQATGRSREQGPERRGRADGVYPGGTALPEFFANGLRAAWAAVIVYWGWSALTTKPAERREPLAKRFFAQWLPLAAAVLLLGPGRWYGDSLLREPFVPHSTPVYSIGLALAVAGAALAIWARYLLGRNWSASVQIKKGHELVVTGPYRLIRHPIYTGLLLLFLGSALMVGDWRGLLAVAIAFASFWFKLKKEEAWMIERFGDVYRDYRGKTRALLPGLL